MNKILDLNNKIVKTMVVIIFFAVTLFAADYLIKNVWYIFGKFFIWFLPFIIGLLISYMLEPLVKALEKVMDRKISSALILIIINIIFIGIVAYCVSSLSSEIVELQNKMPYFTQVIQDKFSYFENGAKQLYFNLPAPITQFLQNNMDKIASSITMFASKSIYLVKVVPFTLKTIVVWFISCFISYLILRDRRVINTFFKITMSNSWKDDLKVINTQIIRAIMGFIKSQIIVIFGIFIVSLLGLLIIKAKYLILISILAGLFSIIPVIGTGLVFIPFIIIRFSVGDFEGGIKLLVIYIITIIVREVLVVKVVSKNVGLDLLSTIISMYVGIEIFGEFGFIIGPLLLIVVIVILKSSIMDKFRKKFNII